MLLSVDDVHTYYGASHVLHGTTLAVNRGEVLGVLGRNGMGKTTLMHTIVAFLRPARGTILLNGTRISGLPSEKVARAGVALVPQGRRVFRSLTVGEHLEVSYRPAGGDGWTIDDVCDRFPILAQRWHQMAALLSGGQQQMLAIGRALLTNGRIVLMDEPAEGLDPRRVEIVEGIIGELRDRGTAVLLVEQKVKFAVDVADRVQVMDRGAITHETTGEQARADPSALSRQLGFA